MYIPLLIELYPDISGARIIWQDTANQDLVLFDLSDGSETRLASGGAQPTLPVIEGSLVAWLENPLSPYRVILLNLATGNTRVLSTNGYSPDISGDRIIWVDSNLGSRGIALYNVTDDRQGMVITDPYDQSQPAISGDRVVWVNGSSSDQIYVKSLSTGDEALVSQSACSNPPCTSDPAFSGDRVAWSDYRDDFDRDIYLSLLSTLSESIFADFPVDQITPSIDGDRIVWMNGSDIYQGDLSGANPPLQISTGTGNFRPRLSGDRVVWYKGTGNKEIYLFTIGSSEPCPSASFTADHPSGISPLSVQFMDTSSGSPGHWFWDFGDGGTSSDQNPVHTYRPMAPTPSLSR